MIYFGVMITTTNKQEELPVLGGDVIPLHEWAQTKGNDAKADAFTVCT
jgi:hypothetical protein